METDGRYLEDFVVGEVFGSGRTRIDTAQIKSFARAFDPQPFHLDEQAARESIFQGLAAPSRSWSQISSCRAARAPDRQLRHDRRDKRLRFRRGPPLR